MLARQVQVLADGQKRLVDTVGDLKGRVLEQEYREKAAGYFGRWLRKTRLVGRDHLEDVLETRVSADELQDVLLTDLVVRGQLRSQPEVGEVWLAVEVSAVVDRADVARAQRRAAVLCKGGYKVIPVAAGEESTLGAEAAARHQGVALLEVGCMIDKDQHVLIFRTGGEK